MTEPFDASRVPIDQRTQAGAVRIGCGALRSGVDRRKITDCCSGKCGIQATGIGSWHTLTAMAGPSRSWRTRGTMSDRLEDGGEPTGVSVEPEVGSAMDGSGSLVPQVAAAPVVAGFSGVEVPPATGTRAQMTGAEHFWYILMCIAFGAGYLHKVPMKKALSDAGLVEMTGAESAWYVVMCVFFGAGYFAKVPVKKALRDAGLVNTTAAEGFWYVLMCIAFGAGYFTKVPMKKALSDVGLVRTTDAESFWYILMCIAFGAGYFAKVPMKKSLSELPQLPGVQVSV